MSSSEGQLKTTKDGRPFAKAFHELFATFLSAVKLGSHRHVFKSYSNTFTTKEAIETLSELKFTQSISQPDRKNPGTVVTTTVTTTFSMDSDMACYLLSEFLQAHLIFNVLDTHSTEVPNDGIYGLTGKGNVLYEAFLRESRQELLASAKPVAVGPTEGASRKADSLLKPKGAALTALVAPSGMVFALERESEDDQMVLNQSVVQELFRSFAGPTPNYEEKVKKAAPRPVAPTPRELAAGDNDSQSSNGSLNMANGGDEQEVKAKVSLKGVKLRDRSQMFKKVKMTFHGRAAINWLMAHTTVVNREEAARLGDMFLANGYIRSMGESSHEFRDIKQAVYAFTDAGQRVVGWDSGDQIVRGPVQDTKDGMFQFGRQRMPSSDAQSTGASSRRTMSMENINISVKPISEYFAMIKTAGGTPENVQGRRQSASNHLPPSQGKEPSVVLSNRQRLVRLLEHQELESLFREFLKSMFCAENLDFYHDVVVFKIRFGDRPLCFGGMKGPVAAEPVGENHPENPEMVQAVNEIFVTYLAPEAPKDINVQHKVRQEIIDYMKRLSEYVSLETGLPKTAAAASGSDQWQQPPAPVNQLRLSSSVSADTPRCPRLTTRLFNKIEEHVFNLMASDSVPKFLKTEAFRVAVTSKQYPGLSPSTAGSTPRSSPLDKQAKRGPLESIPDVASAASADDRKGEGLIV